VSSLPPKAKVGYTCNELGLDTIDMGDAIAYASEFAGVGIDYFFIR